MATRIRLARGGSKKRPFYRIVAADARAPRDGDFIEKLGTYNPLLPKEDGGRFAYDAERMKYWLGVGARPSETIARFLSKDGVWTEKPTYTPKPKSEKLAPRAAARKEAEAEAKKSAKEAEKAEASAEAEAPAPQEEAAVPEASEPSAEAAEADTESAEDTPDA